MREEIIKMARECGDWNGQTVEMNDVGLERFFHMAQAAMIEQGWRKCAEGQRTTQFCGMTEKAVQEEREACAMILDANAKRCSHNSQAQMILHANATAIRARGQA